MTRPGDSIVMVLIIGFILFLFARRWISFQFTKEWVLNKVKKELKPIKGEVPSLLREFGYEPIESRIKIPISIQLDNEPFDSRMFVDYLAMKEDQLYVVLVARDRKPLRRTGASIRDHMFTTFLLYRPEGIVYVDKTKNKVSLVHFSHPTLYAKQKLIPWSYVITFGLGMLIMWLIRQ